MKRVIQVLSLSLVMGLASDVIAASVFFIVPLDGSQEAPGPGDPDGTGSAFFSIDPGALTIDWNITANDIDFPLTGAHIHVAPAGAPGPIVVDFSAQLSGTGLVDADLAGVLANPTGYYINLHNAAFPAGAIRGQFGKPIPEPSTLTLAAIGAASLGLSRRRTARCAASE